MDDKKYHFFWGGVFSNWYPSYFVHKDVAFTCGEQMMMWEKAMLMEDEETAELILQSTSPKEMKRLGRQVKDFNEGLWNVYKYQLVKEGLRSRFLQDMEARRLLKKVKGKILVEASPYDRIWGIGFSEENALKNKNRWGENLLGKILTELSKEV